MIASQPYLEIRLARDENDLLGAQRLRYRVFVEELGGDGGQVDHLARLERDRFDAFADQLILVDRRRPAATLDHVVGSYRLLSGEQAARAGRFYSENEFDLSPLRTSGRKLLELGRSCVDAEHRGGMALFMLWNGLAEYVQRHAFELLFGVASFHGTDVAALSEPLSYLHHHHLARPDLRPRALTDGAVCMDLLPADQVSRRGALRVLPPLIKAYLRIGGQVGEGAFIDADFNTTDVCMILDTARVSPRRRSLYSGGGAR